MHVRSRERRVVRPPWWRGAGGVGGVLAALLFAAASASAQAAVHGRVSARGVGGVDGVSVSARVATGEPRVTRTNAQGNYEITGLAPGRYRITAVGPGYAAVSREVQLASGDRRRIDLTLRAETVVLEGVVVEGRADRDRERDRFENEPGVTARIITGESMKTLPGLAEADVLRSIEVLPGVVSTSDFSSAFNVRGGSADQNLILLDGFTVFNPFHLGGLFSVFNSDAIARAELLAGGFGAEYGGRVSSVLDIETDGTADGLELAAGVSMLATRLLARGPMPGFLSGAAGEDRGGWMVSARRSYFDQVMRPVANFPYHLTDLQGYAQIGLPRGTLSFTAYAGNDVLDLSEFDAPGADADSNSVLRIQWDWGNRVVGARWQNAVGPSWVADTRLGYSTFSDQLGFVDFGGVRFGSSVAQTTLRTELAREFGPRGSVSLGGGVDRLSYDNHAEAGGTEFFASTDRGLLGFAFASFRWRPTQDWIVEPGVRADVWWGGEITDPLLSPRFAVKRFFGDSRTLAAKLAVGRYTQVLHSLRNEEFPVSNDTWILARSGVPSVVSDQIQAGVEKYWGEEWYASLEAYARRFEGITEFNFADDPNDPDDDLLAGDGRSVGLDLFLRRSAGRLTGWSAVSLLRAQRSLPDALAAGWEDLPPTVTFSPIFDRHLDVDLVLQYLLPSKWELGARWNFGSPIPYTRPVSQYFGFRYAPLRGRYEPIDHRGGPPLFVALGGRNRERYPPYHRLDATIRRTFTRSWGSWTPYLQVLNVYNRRNVLFYFYNYDDIPATRSGISMFPVLPALGVEAAFR
ncbi:MAG: TonB-dependent receptor [Gemmatimonadetes bacterium]|nr:TonB-dependent receptor [Gemmatimonadota bacterium]